MSNKIKYDTFNRVVYEFISDLSITYTYSYRRGFRLETIESPYNKTNYKTTILEKKIGNEYVKLKKIEYGEKYITIKKYKDGNRFFFKRFDMLKQTFFIERTIRNKLGDVIFWFEERNKYKNFGFKISNKFLKYLTLKK